MSESTGRLFVVATPIGNLDDITRRAVRCLGEADVVLAEDTRRTLTLLRHLDITTRVESFHAHSKDDRASALAQRMAAGERFALVSDAGTPIVSDPGRRLVAAAIEQGVVIEPIPGASAVLAGLAGAGIECGSFRFIGFLPRSGRTRREAIEQLRSDPSALVLFESPKRVVATLGDLSEVLGADRPAAVCRELTKVYETFHRGTLGSLPQAFEEGVRGEVTLVVAGAREEKGKQSLLDEEIAALIEAHRKMGTPPSEIAKRLKKIAGISRKDAYRLVQDSN